MNFFFSEKEIKATELLRKFIDICRIRTQAISEVDSWDVNKGLGLKSIGIGKKNTFNRLKKITLILCKSIGIGKKLL